LFLVARPGFVTLGGVFPKRRFESRESSVVLGQFDSEMYDEIELLYELFEKLGIPAIPVIPALYAPLSNFFCLNLWIKGITSTIAETY
jgi:hypothetical protein